ncbi:hybrid sensor histidine kinase/response regulator transcription factor [Larkinella humicola]|uniref:histidine kinase n=1 Tax=Larkinella humicola TaxID=2607654 RepID=A0A5N1J657_9BACT|nr:ATP-binding protein [Larkinella humicola]KAA9346404.1 response regulator [Larkinella humicola]
MWSRIRVRVYGLFLGSLVSLSLRAQQRMPARIAQYLPPATINFNTTGATQDQRGHLWFSTNDGIVRFDGRQFRAYHDPVLRQGDDYFHVVPSPDGRIWCKLGRGEVLSYIDPDQDKIIRIPDSSRVIREFLSIRKSHYLFAAADSTLWIGQRGRGLLHFNPRTYAVDEVFSNVDEGVRWITEDRRGTIWFTTSKAVYAYHPLTRHLKRYQQGLGSPVPSPDGLLPIGIHARRDGKILVGLPSEIDVIDPATNQIERLPLTPSRFHPDQTVRDFFDDAAGNTYFRNHTASFRYTKQGELQQLEFSGITHRVFFVYPGQHNRLWVTAGQTLLAYDLNRIRPIPALNLIDIVINQNRLEEPGSGYHVVRDSLGHPTLTVQEGDLITLRVSPQVRYMARAFRLRLDGYDQNWNVVEDFVSQVAYQLAAGTYTLTLNQYNRSLGWEKPVSTMTLIVQPVFWKTAWFWLMVLAVTGSVGGKLLHSGHQRRKLRRELTRREFEAATIRELDELKSRFFTNITHELRTPLTIILNGTEQLEQAPLAEPHRQQLHAIQRNTQHLMRLINETLDMAKLDAGRLEKRERVGDPLAFVAQVVAQFTDLARQRLITLEWIDRESGALSPTDETGSELYYFDDDKLEKIVYNLLSNALKFTPANGQVRVNARIKTGHRLVLVVADTGIGIADHQLTRIFERFHQIDSSSTRAYSGTGIGLALVKELVDWLNGTVSVESTLGSGSVFTVEFPLTPSSTVDPELGVNPPDAVHRLDENRSAPVSNVVVSAGNGADRNVPEQASLPLLLVIEDNEDLRTYLSKNLARSYRVATAENGRLGLAMALAEIPDLIISDVMMPELDGYQLMERLKSDERTSHIPIVLLTAKSSFDSRLKGLRFGADDYLGKPFSLAELSLRISNCFRTRQNWQRRLSTRHPQKALTPASDPQLTREEQFLARLKMLILDHLTDEALDVDWLTLKMGMSRTQLHRKLVALTNRSTTRFIHSVRLEKAVELLQTGELNVAQVAQAVGYSSQSYFTKVFQEELGYVPARLKGNGSVAP